MSTLLLLGLLFTVSLNAVIFLIAYRRQTDTLTDLTYCLSFLGLVSFVLLSGRAFESQGKIIMLALVIIWAVRLGTFLYRRIHKMGHDSRFDQIRVSKKRFFRFFMIQGFGAWMISLPMMIRVLTPHGDMSFSKVEDVEWLGLIIALIGLVIETIADRQKMAFKSKDGNAKKLYTGGLYSVIRYPNYTGEVLFWVGIFVAAVPYLSGVHWAAVISPVLIIFLLVRVSGIPYLERSRSKAYGDDPSYQKYVSKTKMLVPGVY